MVTVYWLFLLFCLFPLLHERIVQAVCGSEPFHSDFLTMVVHSDFLTIVVHSDFLTMVVHSDFLTMVVHSLNSMRGLLII